MKSAILVKNRSGKMYRSIPALRDDAFSIQPTRRYLAAACIVLFGVSLIRYGVKYDPFDTVPAGQESFHLARSLARNGQFANPFRALQTGPSAHLAPAYPALLALLMRSLGEGSTGIFAIKLTGALLLSLQLALFPVFSRELGMGPLNGIIAASLWIVVKVGLVFPPGRQPVAMFAWENLPAGLLIAVAVCAFRRCLDTPPDESNRFCWILGVSLGALALTSPTAGIVFIPCLAWLAWRDWPHVFGQRYLAVVLLPALIVIPWMIRNYVVFGRTVPVRDNFGLELAVGNSDCAALETPLECFAKMHPNASVEEAKKILASGEPRYNDLKLREALGWIRTHPSKFFRLSALRIAAFWIPPVDHGQRTQRIVVCGLTLLSIAGLRILLQRDRQSAALCVLCFGFFPLTYYFIPYVHRYRYPIMWLTFALGAFPLTTFVRQTLDEVVSKKYFACPLKESARKS